MRFSCLVCGLVLLVTQAIGDDHTKPAECEPTAKYVIPNFKTNWFKAMEYCHYLGLKLTRVLGIEDQHLIENAINATDKNSATGFWIGGNDLGETKNFHWYSTGTRITWFNWHARERNNKFGSYSQMAANCIRLQFQETTSSWSWALDECQANSYFICERF